MTIGEVYNKSIDYLRAHKIERPEVSVQYLLSDVLQFPRLQLFINFEKVMTDEQLQKMREYLKRRAKSEPVQYITGSADFHNIRLKVNSRVLIPRPETEILVDNALAVLKGWIEKDPQRIWKIADLGCGSGNISVAVAAELKEKVRITALDISPEALELAAENARAHNAEKFIDFEKSSFSDFLGRQPSLDMVLSNPPYIDPAERSSLPREVADFEPPAALFGNTSGLDYPLEIIGKTSYLMKSPFALFMEIGWDHHKEIEKKLTETGLQNFGFIDDYGHFKRILKILL
jgi:release factor glutamine methyltransferase